MNVTTWGTCGCAIVLASAGWAQVTQRVNVSSSGSQASGSSQYGGLAISENGRYVVFGSEARDLVPGDSNGTGDIFVRDRRAGTTELVSVDSAGVIADGGSYGCAISADGRFVVFGSAATNLVPGDTNGVYDVFVRDRASATTERVSVDSNGLQGNADSYATGSISDDGRYVVFASDARNLVTGDTNDAADVFVHDRDTGTTKRVSVASDGAQGWPFFFNDEFSCDISADGRFVAFVSDHENLVPGDTNHLADVFVHDRRTGATQRVSVDSSGGEQSYFCGCGALPTTCSISADGSCVAFTSQAENLAPGDGSTNPVYGYDVFVHDTATGATERISVDSNGGGGTDASWFGVISGDARFVSFWSRSRNLVSGDSNGGSDVFLRDRWAGTTERVNLASDGTQANFASFLVFSSSAISGDGRYLAFSSAADNIVPGDTNDVEDVFVRDRLDGTEFISVCDPGVGGVIACPCANAPSGPARGCDNSVGTGGAALAASGGTFLCRTASCSGRRAHIPTRSPSRSKATRSSPRASCSAKVCAASAVPCSASS